MDADELKNIIINGHFDMLRELAAILGFEASGQDGPSPDDYIEEVRALKERAAQVRGWVDVTLEEPPEGEHVLTLTADGETQILYLDDDDGWYSAMTGSWWDGSPVEKWHELPALPPGPGDAERADDK